MEHIKLTAYGSYKAVSASSTLGKETFSVRAFRGQRRRRRPYCVDPV